MLIQQYGHKHGLISKYTVFCSISFFYVLFLTLLGQNVFGVITYSLEELVDTRAAVTHQHYQHYACSNVS